MRFLDHFFISRKEKKKSKTLEGYYGKLRKGSLGVGEKGEKGNGPGKQKQPGKSRINVAYFTVLPRGGLGVFLSVPQDDIFGDMF